MLFESLERSGVFGFVFRCLHARELDCAILIEPALRAPAFKRIPFVLELKNVGSKLLDLLFEVQAKLVEVGLRIRGHGNDLRFGGKGPADAIGAEFTALWGIGAYSAIYLNTNLREARCRGG